MRIVWILSVLIGTLFSTATVRADDRFWDELFDPAEHKHFSPCGTPLVHLFLLEPAALHRDLFLDYRIGNNVEGSTDEMELEIELEWALTKRFGFIIEVPYLGLDPAADPNTSGFGDIAVAGRALLIDDPTFQLSANLEVEMATGDVNRGLGRGETAISPTISTWHDLGNWVTLHSQFGPEIGLDSGDAEFIYALAITKSFQGPVLFDSHEHSHRYHDEGPLHHFEPGFTTLILELNGASGLSGEEDGMTFFELIPGIAYTPKEHIELRFGVRFPIFSPERLDSQYLLTFSRMF